MMFKVLPNPLITPLFCFFSWPAMCIHGDKSQPERDWVITGKAAHCSYILSMSIVYDFYTHCSFKSALSPASIFFFFFYIPAEFRSGKAPILIATDVASRGLGMFLSLLCFT